jgi:hypothetical protein
MVLLAASTAVAASGCGVRQFNERFKKFTNRTLIPGSQTGYVVRSYGPIWGAGQHGDVGMDVAALNGPTADCPAGLVNGCCSSSTRPCSRGRFSVALPEQMDSNTNATTPHVTVAGPGRALSTSGPNAPNLPRLEQRDLHLMRKGAAPGEQTF